MSFSSENDADKLNIFSFYIQNLHSEEKTFFEHNMEHLVLNIGNHFLKSTKRSLIYEKQNIIAEYYLQQNNCIESFDLNYNSKSPLFSSLTFLTENNMDFVYLFTNIDFEKYKYKEFSNEFEKSLCFSFPEIGKTIFYDGSKYNGHILLNEIYDQNFTQTILYVNYFEKDKYSTNNILNKNVLLNKNYDIDFYKKSNISSPKELIENNEFLNYDFIENLFYQKNKTSLELFKTKIIKNIDNLKGISHNDDLSKSVDFPNLTYYISSFEKPYLQCSFYNKLCETHGKNIIDEYYKLQTHNKKPDGVVEIENTIFKNKILCCDKIFTKEICKWTQKEIDFHMKKTNVMKVEYVKNIFNFYLIVMESVLDIIKNDYTTSKMNYDIVDLLFVSCNIQNNKELNDIINKQNVFFKIFICLDCNETQHMFVFINNKNNLECKHDILNFLEKKEKCLFLYSNINLYP